MNYEWPNEVPVLKEGQFCTGRYWDDQGRQCLAGWRIRIFGRAIKPVGGKVIAEMTTVCAGYSGSVADINVTRFNDRIAKSDADRIAVWEETLRRCGYEKRGDKFVRKVTA